MPKHAQRGPIAYLFGQSSKLRYIYENFSKRDLVSFSYFLPNLTTLPTQISNIFIKYNVNFKNLSKIDEKILLLSTYSILVYLFT
jgi:hypothetical protein